MPASSNPSSPVCSALSHLYAQLHMNVYRYSSAALLPLPACTQGQAGDGTQAAFPFLHIQAAGAPTIDQPLTFSFPQGDYAVLLVMYKGSCRSGNARNKQDIPEGSWAVIFTQDREFELSTVILPVSLQVMFIAGMPLSLYAAALPVSKNSSGRTNSFPPLPLQDHPASENCLWKLAGMPCEVTTASLYKMHALLTEVLTISCQETLQQQGTGQEELPPYLIVMHQQIHTEYQKPFSLSLWEHQLNVSRYRLCREYTAAFGLPPLKDLTKTRIRKAKELLLSPTLQIQEIAARTGYENTSHFITMFRNETGMTPGQYRRKVKNAGT